MTDQEIIEKAKKRLPLSYENHIIQIPIYLENVLPNHYTAEEPAKNHNNVNAVVTFEKKRYSNGTFSWSFYRIDR